MKELQFISVASDAAIWQNREQTTISSRDRTWGRKIMVVDRAKIERLEKELEEERKGRNRRFTALHIKIQQLIRV
jgi:hypothetical protein